MPSPIENLSDEKLVSVYRKGDEQAFEILIKRYLPLIYGLSRQYAGNPDKAADIAQETFIKAWRKLGTFDQKKLFKPWLFAIAKNTALDWLKRKEELLFSSFATKGESESPLENIVSPLPLQSAAIDQKIKAGKIDALIHRLPEHYYSVISMREKEDLSFREIAKKLQKSLNTVKSLYRRALQLLRNRIREAGDIE